MTEMTLKDSSGDSGLFVTPARYLIRGTGVGSFATLEPATGSPYASMLTVSTRTDGTPLFLISRLAWHTRNLEADPRASILFMSTGDKERAFTASDRQGLRTADPLALGRISVMGRAEKTADPADRERFLARHPEAAGYAAFADFAFYRLVVDKAQYVGGFGRIGEIAGSRLIRAAEEVADWDAQIADALAGINADHGALCAQAAHEPGAGSIGWRMAACDPEGADLVSEAGSRRLVFPEPLQSVYQIPEVLQRLAVNAATSR